MWVPEESILSQSDLDKTCFNPSSSGSFFKSSGSLVVTGMALEMNRTALIWNSIEACYHCSLITGARTCSRIFVYILVCVCVLWRICLHHIHTILRLTGRNLVWVLFEPSLKLCYIRSEVVYIIMLVTIRIDTKDRVGFPCWIGTPVASGQGSQAEGGGRERLRCQLPCFVMPQFIEK